MSGQRQRSKAEAPPITKGQLPETPAEAEAEVEAEPHRVLLRAIDSFVRSNCNFESSIPITTTLEEIGQCDTLQKIFAVPLQRQLFNLDSALRWVLFLSVAPERAEAEGDAPFAKEFSSTEALKLIPQVYDIGAQESVWECFESDSDDEDFDDDEEDPEELE